MKQQIVKLLTVALAALGGLGTMTASKGWLDAPAVAEVNAAGVQLGDSIATIVGAILSYLILALISKLLPGSGTNNGTSGGNVPLLLMAGAMAALLALPSCQLPSSFDDYRLNGSAVLYGENGAKAGLKFTDGQVRPYGRVALYDDDGTFRGFLELEAAKKAAVVIPEK